MTASYPDGSGSADVSVRGAADGSYRIGDLLPGEIEVTANIIADTGNAIVEVVKQEALVEGGEVTRVDFELDAGASMEGSVLIRGEAPVHAQMTFTAESAEAEEQGGSVIGYQQRGEWDRGERPQQSPPIDHIEQSESDPVFGTFLQNAQVPGWCDREWPAPFDPEKM